MKRLFTFAVAVSFLVSRLAIGCSWEEHINWCATDHGFNEGAECGANVASGLGITFTIPVAGYYAWGNAWDRTNMIGLAKTLAKAGRGESVDIAVCCQAHNEEAAECLSDNADAVFQWLRDH